MLDPGEAVGPIPVRAPSRWPLATKVLHWSTVLLVLVVVPAGFLMSATYGPSLRDPRLQPLHFLLSQIHHTVGIIILLVALLWVAHRLRGRSRPPWPQGMPGWERFAARGAHAALLLLAIAIPWSGWTAISALEDSAQFGATHLWFFGFDRLLPRIWTALPFDDPAGYGRFARLHVWFLWAALALLAVHVAAALWHHAYRRDSVLRRMWPLGDGESDPRSQDLRPRVGAGPK